MGLFGPSRKELARREHEQRMRRARDTRSAVRSAKGLDPFTRAERARECPTCGKWPTGCKCKRKGR